jgi:hypothetical protein
VTDFRVDLPGLAAVGRSIQGIAEHLGYVLPGNAHAAVSPEGARPAGWLAWPAMVTVGRLWVAELEVLTGLVAAAGQGAITAAQAYEATDQATARDLYGVGG